MVQLRFSKICLPLICLMVFLLLVGCTQPPPAPQGPAVTPAPAEEKPSEERAETDEIIIPEDYVDIATVPAGPGLWYVLGERLMKVVRDSDLPVEGGEVLPGGGAANVMTVSEGRAVLGLTNSTEAVDALQGKEPYGEGFDNFGMVLSLFPAVYQAVVLDNSGIQNFQDLKGKSINMVQMGSSSEKASRLVFELHGMTYDDLGHVEFLWFDTAYDLMRDGRLHGSLQIGPLPHPDTVNLAAARDIRLISLEEDIVEKIIEINPGYTKYVIPAGAYRGVDKEVLTVASPTILIARLDASEELIYALTKLFFEEWDKSIAEVHPLLNLSKEELAKPAGVKYHPGAEKYLREVGLLK